MENLQIYQIDAFTDKVFHGNPAAICLLNEWLNDELMQAIAVENNLSETAFVLHKNGKYHIRWFTPNGEIELCGHATLAAGFLLFELGHATGDEVSFSSLSGELRVRKAGEMYSLDFPALTYQPAAEPNRIAALVNRPALAVYDSELDYLIVLENEKSVAEATVDNRLLSLLPKRGLILTAKATDTDFYSRCFYPKFRIFEDPVTGSAHCVLTPFWQEQLNKPVLTAQQGSIRKGRLKCWVENGRVLLAGHCRWYMKGELVI